MDSLSSMIAQEDAQEHAETQLMMRRIGKIVAVSGGRAVIMLDKTPPDEEAARPEIGTLLKVDMGETVALALVSSMSMPVPDSGLMDNDDVRVIEVEFVGEIERDEDGAPKSFRRGVSHYPGLDEVVALATREELQLAYACDEDVSISVGHIHQDKSIPAMVKLDEMLGKHFAILGTTGTGKSCTVALILRRILEKNPNAHILLLDVHREYAAAFSDLAEVIRPEDLNLPFWLLNFEEICEILVGEHSHAEVDTEVLRELIPLARARYRHGNTRAGKLAQRNRNELQEAQSISVDTPLPYRSSDLMALLDEHIGKLDNKSNLAPYKRIKAKLESVTRDPRYAFMFGSLTVNDSMTEVISRLFRIPVSGKPISVLELGGLPSEVINVVVSVLARMAFDFALYSSGKVPITFVCEEAHRYVPNDQTAGFEPTRRALSRIAKEGRKYGVSLCIITQRPAELDPTILSQCNTIFSLRLTNERDQEILRAGISDSAASLLDFMPTMGVGEAVAFGEGVSLPTRIRFDLLPQEHLPRSNTASFSKSWRTDINDPNFLQEVVRRWRNQDLGSGAGTAAQGAQGAQSAAQPFAPAQAAPSPDALAQPPAGQHEAAPSLASEVAMAAGQHAAPQQPAMPQQPAGMPQAAGAQPAGMPRVSTPGTDMAQPAATAGAQPHAPQPGMTPPANPLHAGMPQEEAASAAGAPRQPAAPAANASGAQAAMEGGAQTTTEAAAEIAEAAPPAASPAEDLRSSLRSALERFRKG